MRVLEVAMLSLMIAIIGGIVLGKYTAEKEFIAQESSLNKPLPPELPESTKLADNRAINELLEHRF